MSIPSIDLRTQFVQDARVRMEELVGQRGLTVPSCRHSHIDMVGLLPGSLQYQVEALTTAEARTALNERSVNEYWLLYMACTAASLSDELPFGAGDVAEAAAMLARVYPDQQLVAKVNTGMFHDLSETELSTARRDGIIVTDETWPFPSDQDRINPVYIPA